MQFVEQGRFPAIQRAWSQFFSLAAPPISKPFRRACTWYTYADRNDPAGVFHSPLIERKAMRFNSRHLLCVIIEHNGYVLIHWDHLTQWLGSNQLLCSWQPENVPQCPIRVLGIDQGLSAFHCYLFSPRHTLPSNVATVNKPLVRSLSWDETSVLRASQGRRRGGKLPFAKRGEEGQKCPFQEKLWSLWQLIR